MYSHYNVTVNHFVGTEDLSFTEQLISAFTNLHLHLILQITTQKRIVKCGKVKKYCNFPKLLIYYTQQSCPKLFEHWGPS